MADEIVPGLPFPILYIVHSIYEMASDSGEGFELHKDTGVPAQFPMQASDIFDEAFEIDADNLQYAGEGSRGTVIRVLDRYIARTLYRGP